MPDERETRADRDERLRRLGRAWFAEVRLANPDEPARRRRRTSAGEGGDGDGGSDIWAGLFGGRDGDGCESGDGGD